MAFSMRHALRWAVAASLVLLLSSTAQGASMGPYGTVAKSSAATSPGYMAELTDFAVTPVLVFRDGSGTASTLDTTDTVYLLVVDPATTATVRVNDVILSGSGKGTRVASQLTGGNAVPAPSYCFVDTGTVDGAPNPGEVVYMTSGSIYLPLSGTSSGLLTATSPGACTALTPTWSFLDADGTGGYSSGDKVYLRTDGASNGFVKSSDVRIIPAASTFGSRPVLGDADARGILATPPLAAVTLADFFWLDSDGGGDVDTTEPIVLDVTSDGQDASDPVVATGTSCTTLGTGCTVTGTWARVTTASGSPALKFFDAGTADGILDAGDTLYIHFGAGTNVGAGDVRLTRFNSNAAGARVTTGESPVVTAAPSLVLGYYDKNNDGAFNKAEPLYLFDATFQQGADPQYALPSTFRLHSSASLTYGAAVAAVDKDSVMMLSSPSKAVFTYEEIDGTPGQVGLEDSIFLRPLGTASCTVTTFGSTDVRVSAGSQGGAAGTYVSSGAESGHANTCPGTAPQLAYYSTTPGSYSATSLMYLDLDPSGSAKVGVRDVRITGSTSGSAGSKVQSSSTDSAHVLTDLTVDGATALRACLYGLGACPMAVAYVDDNGNGVQSPNDPVVLDMDGDGFVTIGDVLLTGTGGTTGLGTSPPPPPPPPVVNPPVVVPPPPPPPPPSPPASPPPPVVNPPVVVPPPPTGPDLAAINQALASSLTVTRQGENHVLQWTPQTGVMGYQVWSHSSPWVKLADVTPATVGTYTDLNAAATTAYTVTAYTSMDLSGAYITDLNTQLPPGLTTVPVGVMPSGGTQTSGTTSSGQTHVPGFELVAFTVALGAAVLLARRR